MPSSDITSNVPQGVVEKDCFLSPSHRHQENDPIKKQIIEKPALNSLSKYSLIWLFMNL